MTGSDPAGRAAGDPRADAAPARSVESLPPLAERAELLGLAQEAGRFGLFEWLVPSGSVQLSPQFRSRYGLESFDGRLASWYACIFREDRIRLTHQIDDAFAQRARELGAEFRITRASDAAVRWIEARYLVVYDDASGAAERVVGIHVDVTEHKRAVLQLRAFTESLEERVRDRSRELEEEFAARERAEQSLRQAQKMEVVGRLTGGIAHDFNNLLTVVLGGLEVIGRQVAQLPDSPSVARIGRAREMAEQSVRRAATLIHRLMAFSRQQPLAPTALDANRLVAGISEMLRRTLGETIALETVLAGGLWPSYADENQLESAMLNLAVNAHDAMPDGGRLTIETANCHLDEAYVAKLAEPVAAGQYVMIAVTDTGTGMSPATVERAFEPFFTTKAAGQGTGLGLSQVYGFVRQSGGHIRIYSELGEGTSIKLYLPRHLERAAVTRGGDLATAPDAPRALAAEHVLVVEDDEALREHAGEMLRELGYRVTQAADAAAALRLLESDPAIALLFTDVVMPGGVNGRELADAALRRRPGLRVLFATGYTRNAIIHNGRLDPGIRLLTKPYSFRQLAEAVRAALGLDA